jgi:hypothetical protein
MGGEYGDWSDQDLLAFDDFADCAEPAPPEQPPSTARHDPLLRLDETERRQVEMVEVHMGDENGVDHACNLGRRRMHAAQVSHFRA